MSKRTNQTARAVMKLAHSIKSKFTTFSAALKSAWAQVKQPRKIIEYRDLLAFFDVKKVLEDGTGFSELYVEETNRDFLIYVSDRGTGERLLSALKKNGLSATASGKNGKMFAKVARTSVTRKIDVSGMVEYKKDVKDQFFYGDEEKMQMLGGIKDATTENWFFNIDTLKADLITKMYFHVLETYRA